MTPLQVDAAVLREIAEHAEACYSEECCGLLFGPASEAGVVTEVQRFDNLASKYHALDPEQYVRDGRTAFIINARKKQKAVEEAAGRDMALRGIYHSHCDALPYFSHEDVAAATMGGDAPVEPELQHLVMSVQAGKARAARVHRWEPDAGRFVDAVLQMPERDDG